MTKIKNPKQNNPIEKHFRVISRYHYYLFTVLFLSKFFLFWHILNLLFLSPPMKFYCNVTSEEEALANPSLINFCPCDDPWWDRSVFSETMQTKFDVYCENSWLISFSQSMLYAGLLIGALFFGFLSDRFGRLVMFTTCCLIIAVSGTLVSVMPTAASFIFMRCIEGIGSGGGLVICYVLCVEYCGVQHREMITALFHLPGNLSHMTLAGISYMFRDCDDFQLALSIPMFIFIALKWLLMESPKWLMDNGHIDEAAKVMERFCHFNRNSCENIKEELISYRSFHTDNSNTNAKFWEIFKHKKLGLYFLCMCIIYFVCGMGYYGVSQFIGRMGGNIHTNVAISGAVLLPGTIASIFLLKILPRRTFLMSTNFLSGVFILIVLCIPQHLAYLRIIRVAMACVCNSFFFISFIIVFLYGVELFPTSIRNSTLGVLSVLSRIGQIVTPPINELSEVSAGAIYAAMAILGAILCFPLPETKNTELPSTIKDTKSLSKKKKTLEDDGAGNSQAKTSNE